MPLLTIIRGLHGSGKSTLAQTLSENTKAFHIETDMYFTKDDIYKFDASKIKKAHEWTRHITRCAMESYADIIVSNTFTQLWEYQPYLDMAKEYNYQVQVIECHAEWQNAHDVPQEVIERMRKRWQPHNFDAFEYVEQELRKMAEEYAKDGDSGVS